MILVHILPNKDTRISGWPTSPILMPAPILMFWYDTELLLHQLSKMDVKVEKILEDT